MPLLLKWIAPLASTLFLACLIVQRWHQRFSRSSLTLTFFDVGQGDSSLIQFPGGKTLLIDAGGGFDEWNVGKVELFAELTRMGILTLDTALLTHPDQDHGYGFNGLFGEIDIKNFWFNRTFEKGSLKPLFHHLTTLASEKTAELQSFNRPTRLSEGGAEMLLIPLDFGHRKDNNRPLVLKLDYAGCTAWFTADIEEPAETRLLPWLGSTTILKVAHHGSKSSSSSQFLHHTRPRFAVISSGTGNSYGHPHGVVLQRFSSMGTQVFRTDFHGYVQFVIQSDGVLNCFTGKGECGRERCPLQNF